MNTKTLTLIATTVLVAVLAGCATSSAGPTANETPALARDEISVAEFFAEPGSRWFVECSEDPVTAVRMCRAATLGRAYYADRDGLPETVLGGLRGLFSGSTQVSVVYLDDRGPYIEVASHDYPGERPVMRIDSSDPIVIQDDGGATEHTPQPEVPPQLMDATRVLVRYFKWPAGAEEIILDARGFADAWQELQDMLKSPDDGGDPPASGGTPR